VCITDATIEVLGQENVESILEALAVLAVLGELAI
jgi:hypothetical protein